VQNRRTSSFRSLFTALPPSIRSIARKAFRLFQADPMHPSLRNHALTTTGAGRHIVGSRSVSITMSYRAIYFIDGETNVWYWIGTHADYDSFVGRK